VRSTRRRASRRPQTSYLSRSRRQIQPHPDPTVE
jgi:hypothetical protein